MLIIKSRKKEMQRPGTARKQRGP